MTKYNDEIKKKFIELMESDKHSVCSAAKELNVSRPIAQRWWTIYSSHGIAGLIKKYSNYDGAFKIYAIKYMHDNHLSVYDASAKLGIPSDNTLSKWERIYYENGEDGLLVEKRGRPAKNMKTKSVKNLPKKIDKNIEEDIISEVQRLRAENAYLKKYNALVLEKKLSTTKRNQK